MVKYFTDNMCSRLLSSRYPFSSYHQNDSYNMDLELSGVTRSFSQHEINVHVNQCNEH